MSKRMQRHACSIPAASAASWNRRFSWRVVIGLPAFGLETANVPPAELRHQDAVGAPSTIAAAGRACRATADIAVFAALDCSTRMIFCALSMCLTLSLTTRRRAGRSHSRD